jgi:hypothetical protein
MYLPLNWDVLVHPEGQRYFYRKGEISGFDIVTEANIYCAQILEKVVAWIEIITGRISKEEAVAPDQYELFLQLDGEDCGYYFVNKCLHRLFWLSSVNTEELGLPKVASNSHLGISIT